MLVRIQPPLHFHGDWLTVGRRSLKPFVKVRILLPVFFTILTASLRVTCLTARPEGSAIYRS